MHKHFKNYILERLRKFFPLHSHISWDKFISLWQHLKPVSSLARLWESSVWTKQRSSSWHTLILWCNLRLHGADEHLHLLRKLVSTFQLPYEHSSKNDFCFSYLMRERYFSNLFQIFLWYIPRENQAKNEVLLSLTKSLIWSIIWQLRNDCVNQMLWHIFPTN